MQTAIGYVFNEQGQYSHKWIFEFTYKNVASFIYMNSHTSVTITDIADELVCTSIGGFLDRFGYNYTSERANIVNEIQKLQFGYEQPSQFNFQEVEDYVMKDI